MFDLERLANGNPPSETALSGAPFDPFEFLLARLGRGFLEGLRIGGSVQLDDWIAGFQSRIDVLRDAACEFVIASATRTQQRDAAVRLACMWHEQAPENERVTILAMQAAIAGGASSAAARVYAAHASALATENAQPSDEARSLYAGLAAIGVRPGDRSAAGSTSGPSGSPTPAGALPTMLDRFVARGEEIAECRRYLVTHRLVTVWAPGGAGKTRLAVELGRSVESEYDDGVWFVPLGEVADPDLVAPTVARTLGLAEEPGIPPERTIAAAVAGRRLLLILDNCEHVREACARLVVTVLAAGGDSRIVATSREPLGVTGELVIKLEPFAVPPPGLERGPEAVDSLFDSPSVELFAERASTYDPTFVIDEESAPAVIAICTRAEGLPLALEIAAASLRTLSVHEVASGLDARFEEIALVTDDTLHHHETIHEVIDWSYRLLDVDTARLFVRLAVFPATWSLAGAEEVAADCFAGDPVTRTRVLALLDRLVRTSLVIADRRTVPTRYRFSQLVRVFALERLEESGDARTMRDRLVWWCLSIANTVVDLIGGSSDLDTSRERIAVLMRSLRRELPSLRAAISWAGASDPAASLRIVSSVDLYWWSDGRATEALAYLEQMLPLAELDIRTEILSLSCAASYAWSAGRGELRDRYLKEGTNLDPPPVADPPTPEDRFVLSHYARLHWLAALHLADSNWRFHCERALAVARVAPFRSRVQYLVRLAVVYQEHGAEGDARRVMEEVEALRHDDHEYHLFSYLWHYRSGRKDTAAEHLRNGMELASLLPYPAALYQMEQAVTDYCRREDLRPAALAYAARLLESFSACGLRGQAADSAEVLRIVYDSIGDSEKANTCARLAEGLRTGLSRATPMTTLLHDLQPTLNHRPADVVPVATEAEADGWSIDDAVAVARADSARLAADDPASRDWIARLERAEQASAAAVV